MRNVPFGTQSNAASSTATSSTGTSSTGTSSATTESTSQTQASPEVNARRTQRQPHQRFAALAPRRSRSPPASRPTTNPPRPQNASPVTRQKTNAELFVEWDDWAQKGHAQDGNRAEAVRIMKAWVDNSNLEKSMCFGGLSSSNLDEPMPLEGLRLTSLPENLPENLRFLEASNNRLTRLPESLPKNLQHLVVNNNRLTRLPEGLPNNLTSLVVEHNLLSNLPESLPESLEDLIVNHNRLTNLPENLPENLKCIFVNNNLLSRLPENLPESLDGLYVSHNQIIRLPENLPENLKNLSAYNNQLPNLPENLPESLENLSVYNNQLTSLPGNLPASLETVLATSNPLSSLPENILNLPNTCSIHITADHLSERVRSTLEEAMNTPDYDNVRIFYSMAPPPTVQVRAIQEEVSAWADEVGNLTPRNWPDFQSAPHAHQFAQFLVRLRETGDYRMMDTKPDFQQRVGNLLGKIQDDSEVREICFNLAQDAVESCGDRVALRMLNMETICQNKTLENHIRAGHYNHHPQPVLDYCKAQYRQQTLSEVAATKIKSLHFSEEIEVMLGFLVAFNPEFNLNTPINTMLYPTCSSITPEDVFETRKKLTTKPFTEETKALYLPFFEKQGRQHLIDSWNALPVHEVNASEKTANNDAFQKFLISAPAMESLLKKKYPSEVASLQADIKQEIEAQQEALQDQVQALDSEHPQYRQQCDALQKQYNNVPAEITAKRTQSLLQRLCLENQMHANMD